MEIRLVMETKNDNKILEDEVISCMENTKVLSQTIRKKTQQSEEK